MNNDGGGAFILKTRGALHGSEDSIKYEQRTDCSVSFPTRVRILVPSASIHKWQILQANVELACLPTGASKRSVYVKRSRKSGSRYRFL